MVCNVTSLGLNGVEGYPVAAECALSRGLPAFDVVGLPAQGGHGVRPAHSGGHFVRGGPALPEG